MKRIRVLHIVLDLEAGGLERLVIELATRADPLRFESHVLVLRFAGRHAAELEGMATLHVMPRQSKWSMVRPTALARRVRAIAPDVVHTHSGVWYKAARAAKLAHVRTLVHTDHGRLVPDRWHDRVVDAIAARSSDVVVAVSDPLAVYLRRRLRVSPAKLRVIRNGVDTSEFAPAQNTAGLRRELGVGPNRLVVGSVGRLEPVKAYDVLINAFTMLHRGWASGAAPVLVIAGDGPEEPRLRSIVAELPVDVRRDIHLLGWRTDARQLLPAFDVFAMASLSEGTSVSLLEAMSAGVCPVVTAVGGNADVLGLEIAHRLVASGDAVALATGLHAALHNSEKRIADGQRARRRVAAAFNLDTMLGAYEALYARRSA